jgi:hypothetical protein
MAHPAGKIFKVDIAVRPQYKISLHMTKLMRDVDRRKSTKGLWGSM